MNRDDKDMIEYYIGRIHKLINWSASDKEKEELHNSLDMFIRAVRGLE